MGQKGGHAYIWAPIGSRPPMVRDNRHVSTYIFGAICPDRAVGAALIMPYANTEAMNDTQRDQHRGRPGRSCHSRLRRRRLASARRQIPA